MPRYFFEISYKGSRYSGWQKQPNAPSVQADIEGALSTLLRYKADISGCGRTDAGVHARQFFFHTDLPRHLNEQILHPLNRMLHKDIAVHRLWEVAGDAHSRFDALQRTYHYSIHFNKDPFLQDFSYYYPYGRPDPGLLTEVAALLQQTGDFKSFCKSQGSNTHYRCRIDQAEWVLDEQNKQWRFIIKADRFLRGMVRLIVGSMLYMARGKISMASFHRDLKEGRRIGSGLSAPAQGLALVRVRYPEELFQYEKHKQHP